MRHGRRGMTSEVASKPWLRGLPISSRRTPDVGWPSTTAPARRCRRRVEAALLELLESKGIRAAVILEVPRRTPRHWSALADINWRYDYFDLVGVGGRIVRRPLVPLSFGTISQADAYAGDSRAGRLRCGVHTRRWGLTDELELDPTSTSDDEVVRIAVGGRSHDVHLAQVELSLFACADGR